MSLKYKEMLKFKEERIRMWEEYGCILSNDGSKCEFAYGGEK